MTLDADIITKELKSALTVPNSAIVPYKGGKAVRKLNDKNEIEFIPVSIGSKGESRTQILNGLTEDQKIIISISEDQAKGQGLLGL